MRAPLRPAGVKNIVIARFSILALGVLFFALGDLPQPTSSGAAPSDSTVITDSLYNANHPCLLFTPEEIPALRAKLSDGGPDDAALAFIKQVITDVYYSGPLTDMLGYNDNDPVPDYGLSSIPNLGIATHICDPPVVVAEDVGRVLTIYIADNYEVNDDIFTSSLRLRSLCLGYDMFFANATEEERGKVRDEIRAYLGYMRWKTQYTLWEFRPYLSNKTAMLAASLGLASIVLRDEAGTPLLDSGLAQADHLVGELFEHQWDENGAAREGVLYGAWSLRNLIYYFEARLRYDGFDFSTMPALRETEEWLAYELDPTQPGRVNNIQDCTAVDYPLARHTTYLDWAQKMWGSDLAAYLWDQAAGELNGFDMEDYADKAGTALWSQGYAGENPTGTLPESMLWHKRGLFYYRTGWPSGPVSDDVVFSFYAGKFEGGHQQEEQGQFTLTAYGHHFAQDHGPGDVAKQSSSHNMVLINGQGQHFAGSGIGTDASIETAIVGGGFADLVASDLSAAYGTYSEWNNPNTPFPGADWTWGYLGANPVQYAERIAVAVNAGATAPYFVIVDDIKKDDDEHEYAWRLHTEPDLTVNTGSGPIEVVAADAQMDLHVLHPRTSAVSYAVDPFDNQGIDPNSQVVSLKTTGDEAQFAVLIMPRQRPETAPMVARSVTVEGRAVATVFWAGDMRDVVIINLDGGHFMTGLGTYEIATDARVAVVRFIDGNVAGFTFHDGSTFAVDGVEYAQVNDGMASVSWFEGKAFVGYPGPDLVFRHLEVTEVRYRDQVLPLNLAGDVVSVGDNANEGDTPRFSQTLRVRAFPNPFTPASTISVQLGAAAHVVADIFNASGQRVRRLHQGEMPAGERSLRWDGRAHDGSPVASGVYFVRVKAGGHARTVKLTLVR